MEKIPENSTSPSTQQLFQMRPIELSDVATIAGWYQQIEDVSIFDRQVPVPINHIDVTTLITSLISDQEKEKCRWFVAEASDGTLIGMTGLESINLLHGHAILPLFIAAPWRRCGLGIRMAGMMIDMAFKQLRLHRVSTVYRADNKSSESLLNKLGFYNEGISRQSWFSQGQYFDLMNVGLLEADWQTASSTLHKELSRSVILTLGPRASQDWCWPSEN